MICEGAAHTRPGEPPVFHTIADQCFNSQMAFHSTLAASRIGADDAPRALVMLHGIYGRGRNWQGIARALVAARPDYACWLVDLPHHGDSGPGPGAPGVRDCADAVLGWMASAGVTPRAVLGHSYGGKVALAMLPSLHDVPLQVWVIDSTPETKPASGSAWDMLRLVRRLPARFASRTEAQEALVAGGVELGVAQWMATNLVRDDDHLRWSLDFDVMDTLLHDFFRTDMWAPIEQRSALHDIHVLKATRSEAISAAAVARLQAAAGQGLTLHTEEGGHWIHAERPDLMVRLLSEGLPQS